MRRRKITSTNFLNQSMMESRCVLNRVLGFVGKRWIPEILLRIEEKRVQRFATLKHSLPGISDQMLSKALAELVRQQVIERKVFKEAPLRVEYCLTQGGEHLVAKLQDLCQWGKLYLYPEQHTLTVGQTV